VITSQETGEIAAAMAKAQAVIENPTKHKTAKVKSDKGNYDYMYTDLAAGLECIRPALSAQSVAVLQVTTIDRNGNMILLTRLIHGPSGQWIESEYYVCKVDLDHQKRGSALTYSRRQSLFAMVGVAGADDDDDGKGASVIGNGGGGHDGMITNAQAELIRTKLASTSADVAKFLAFFKVESVVDLRSSQFREAMNLLSAKKVSAKEIML
jgi:hypothetical protein